MFTSLTSNFDFTIKLIALALFILSLVYVGFGFVFRIIFKILRVKFSSSKLNEVDEQLLDLQLIRLCHGITLDNISDIELYSEAIKRGEIKAPSGWLLPSYQATGKRIRTKLDYFIAYFIAFLLIVLVFLFAVSTTKGQKYNYTEFSNTNNEYVLVSDLYVYDPVTKIYYNENRCNKLTDKSKEVIRDGCEYMLTNDPQMKKELHNGIKISNRNLRLVAYICSIMYLASLCILIFYPRSHAFNNSFYAYKLKRKKS